MAQLGVPFPLCRQYSWQKPLALTEKICQIVFEGQNQDHMHSALNKELSAQCSSRRIKQSASQTWRRPSDNACSPLAYLRHLPYLHFLKKRTFFFSPIETDTDSYQTSFWHPNKLCPLQCFLLAFLEFLAFSNLLICNKIASTTWPQIVAKMMLFLQMCLQGKSWEKFPDSEARRARKVILIIIRCPVSSHLSAMISNARKPQRTACVYCIIPFVVGICPMCLVCC